MLMITLSELKINENEKYLKFENIKKDFLDEIDLRKQNGDNFFEISKYVCDDDVYLDKLQTRGVKQSILYM
jgi:hypothetical protein